MENCVDCGRDTKLIVDHVYENNNRCILCTTKKLNIDVNPKYFAHPEIRQLYVNLRMHTVQMYAKQDQIDKLVSDSIDSLRIIVEISIQLKELLSICEDIETIESI